MLAINAKTTMDKLSDFYAAPHHAHKRADRDRNRDRSASLPSGAAEPNNPRPTTAASLTGRRLRTRSRTHSSPLLLPHSMLSLNSSSSAHLHRHLQHNHNFTNAPASTSRRNANPDSSSSAATPFPGFVRRRSNPETLDYEKERLKRQQLAEMYDLDGFEGIDNHTSRDFNNTDESPVSGSNSPIEQPATPVMLPLQQAENLPQAMDNPLMDHVSTPREESDRHSGFTTPPTLLTGLRISTSPLNSVPNSPKVSPHDRIDTIDIAPPVPSVEPNTVVIPSSSTSTGSKTNSIFFSTSSSFDLPRPLTPTVKPSTPPVSRPPLEGATYAERVRHMAATDAVANTRRGPAVPPIITLPTILPSSFASSQNHHLRHENPVKTPVLGPTTTTSRSTPSSSASPSHPPSRPSSRPPSRPPSRPSSRASSLLRYSASNGSDIDDEDGFLALPSPSPATPVHTSPLQSPSAVVRHHIFPIAANSYIIPVLPPSSPLLLPLPPNTYSPIPSLSDLPMLGDDLALDRTKPVLAPANYHHMKDEDLLGKTMGGYRVVRLLGVGAFSRVYLGETVGNEKEKVAIKLVPKERMRRDPRVKASVEREGGVLKFINHSNVVRLLTSMETEHHLCLVLEYVPGGELFDLVERMHESDDKGVDETLVKKLFLQLVDAVQWLHENNVVHRDLKLENILVNNPGDSSITQLKVTDFGLARIIDPANPTLTTRCGSEEYAAPEIIRNQGYDGRRTDVWALGVILYAMLVGELPFTYAPERGEKVSHLFYKIMKAEVKWPKMNMEGAEAEKGKGKGAVSEEAKEVVAKILVRDSDRRIKLGDLRALKWFREENEEAETKEETKAEAKAEMV